MEKRKKAAEAVRIEACLGEEVGQLLAIDQPIWTSVVVQERLKSQHVIDLPRQKICQHMRKKLKLGYRKTNTKPVQANS